jgi:hypothetical protein
MVIFPEGRPGQFFHVMRLVVLLKRLLGVHREKLLGMVVIYRLLESGGHQERLLGLIVNQERLLFLVNFITGLLGLGIYPKRLILHKVLLVLHENPLCLHEGRLHL